VSSVAAKNEETNNPKGLGLPVAAPESVGMSAERLERVTTAMQGYIDRGQVAGVVTLIARRGKVVHLESLGYRHAEGKAPMTDDTIFRLASMTKPIASVALMMLWEEGHFQLRDPISKFLPEYAEMDVATVPDDNERVGTTYKRVAAARPITVQHILTHTAGFPNNYRGLTKDDYLALRAKRDNNEGSWTIGTMSKELAQMPLNFHPGDKWEYGPATDIVGRLVEVISGQTFDEFLKEHVFGPLDMTDTHFYLPAEKVERFAALYRPNEEGKYELTEAPSVESRYIKEPHTYFSGAGGLVSTARDYFRFHQMMLNGGELDGVRLLGPKTVELMTTNHIGDLETWLRGPGYGFGLGYSVVTNKGLSGMPAQLGSYAWGGAFCTVFWVDPKEELIGILMTQIRPYTHINIRQDLQTLTYQAILE
jgi:CubicO group peptidase (beta-lactamase class C family)